MDRVIASWERMSTNVLALIQDNANTRNAAASHARHGKIAVWAMVVIMIAGGAGISALAQDERDNSRRDREALGADMRARSETALQALRLLSIKVDQIETAPQDCPKPASKRQQHRLPFGR